MPDTVGVSALGAPSHVVTAPQSLAVLDIKSASVDVLSILLRSADPAQIHHELGSRLARRPKTFAGEPFLLDLSNLDEGVMNTLPELYRILHEQGVRIIGVRHAHPSVGEQAQALGWNWFPAKLERPPAPVTTQAPAPAVAEVSPAPAEPTPVADTSPATPDSPCCKTLVIDRPVRAGQQVYARDGDLVVLAAVSSGAELIADGNIHIYAPCAGGRWQARAAMPAHGFLPSSCLPSWCRWLGCTAHWKTSCPPPCVGALSRFFWMAANWCWPRLGLEPLSK